jgi:predicted nuclease with TOPRIM domain
LDLARRRIKMLEKERASLEKQKRELASSVVRLQDEWTRRLGGGAPVKSEGKSD